MDLLDDLSAKFLDDYRDSHSREDVEDYGHYFLGSIVVSHQKGLRYIVDGQQRLTTLTLFLIHLHRLGQGREDYESVESLISSTKFGKRSFNLDVPERTACLEALLQGEGFNASEASDSVRNICERYDDLVTAYPEKLTGKALPYFIDWLRENVHLVEIEAFSDEDAYTIFETMNDRGLSLSLPDMLKGYVLANIRGEADQRKVNAIWKDRMLEHRKLAGLDQEKSEEDVDFFKNWLRGRHAESSRSGEGDGERRDYERIGSEFHRWVRDQHDHLGLKDSPSFVRFVERDLDFYARQNIRIRKAAKTLTPGLESIRYNEDRLFTSQTQLLLAALTPTDSEGDILLKLRLVADFLDIWIARRQWASRDTSQSTVRYTVFNLCKKVRNKSPAELSELLVEELSAQADLTFAKHPDLRLNRRNRWHVIHILARLSSWVDAECGTPMLFDEFVSPGRKRRFEIEHIWPNRPERFQESFEHPTDFERARNLIGGLVLLQRSTNQSLGDAPYEAKQATYLSQGVTLLTQSLHPQVYQNNPAFRAFLERTGLEFQAHEHFDVKAQRARQELYIRIAEWVWNPNRLSLGEVLPPVPEAIIDPDEETGDEVVSRDERRTQRYAFWQRVIQASKERSGVLAHLKPTEYHWLGAREQGLGWNLIVSRETIRAELYIDLPDVQMNRTIFERLRSNKEQYEREFGGALEWEALDDRRAKRISVTCPGGWRDEAGWNDTADRIVTAQEALVRVLRTPALEARKSAVS